MRLFSFSGLCLSLLPLVLADTEIRNLHLSLPGADSIDILPADHLTWVTSTDHTDMWTPRQPIATCTKLTWYRLSSRSPLELSVSSDQAEQRILLDFGEDGEAWTVRVSWPGSVGLLVTLSHDTLTVPLMTTIRDQVAGRTLTHQAPTKWDLAITPSSPRTAILHLTAAPLSPPFPHPLLSQLNAYLPSYLRTIGARPVDREGSETETTTQWETTTKIKWETKAHILLEPLILGVIPSTAVPAVGWISVLVFGAGLVVPRLITWLEAAKRADQALESDNDPGFAQQSRSKAD